MTTTHDRIETASTAQKAARAALDAGLEKRREYFATDAKLAAEELKFTEASQTQSINGEVPKHIGDTERIAAERRFIAKTRERFEAYELRDLEEQFAQSDLELARSLYAGEEARLRQHESEVAQAIRILQKVTGNSRISVGGGESEVQAKQNSDFIGDRLEALVRFALQNVRAKEANLADVQQTSINLKREYIRRYGQ